MQNLTRSRWLIGILVVLLQLGLAPIGQLSCAGLSGPDSCCCVLAAGTATADGRDRPASRHSCCKTTDGAATDQLRAGAATGAATVAADDQRGSGGDLCHCGAGPFEPRDPQNHIPSVGGGDWLPRSSTSGFMPRPDRTVKRPLPRRLPRFATGKALHVIYQVFLI